MGYIFATVLVLLILEGRSRERERERERVGVDGDSCSGDESISRFRLVGREWR